MIRIGHAVPPDSWAWLEMRNDLWPNHENSWHAEEIKHFFNGMLKMPLAVLVAEDESTEIVGFVELNIRPYAEDCLTDRVAFLEGWYVKPNARKKGVGRALVQASLEWGREQGCTEFASDAELDNEVSEKAHLALGFEEVNRIRCYKKLL